MEGLSLDPRLYPSSSTFAFVWRFESMSNPNPLVPQGSLLEQQARSKSTFQMAAFIVALHVVVLGGFLFLGCKKEENQAPSLAGDSFAPPPPVLTETNDLPPLDPYAPASNIVTGIPPSYPGTNAGFPPVTQTVDPTIPPPFVPSTPSDPGAGSGALGGAEHVVKKGEVAFVIAKKNGVTLKQLQEANPGRDLAKLKVGDKLVIPAGGTPAVTAGSSAVTASTGSTESVTYVVKGGDNLSRLAKKYGTTVKAIRDVNGMKSNDIRVGQKLKIPSKTAAVSDPAPAPSVPPPFPTTAPTAIPANPLPQ
jgi:LysM repeat protein